jgi:hypothetical protein
MKISDIFESRTCGRCGGSGSYSYNPRHGTMCYGCNGRRRVFTGADQHLAADLLRARERAGRYTPGEVKVGDRIRVRDDHTFKMTWLTVATLENDEQFSSIRVTSEGGAEASIHFMDDVERAFTIEDVLALCENPETVARVRAAQARATEAA